MSDADPYRAAPLHEIERGFSFDRDSRRLLRRIARRARVWRIMFAIFAFLGAWFVIVAQEPDVPAARVPLYLALATCGGWLLAVVTKLGNNSIADYSDNRLALMVADRFWAFTGKTGMVLFTRDAVFLECERQTIPLSTILFEYSAERRELHLTWTFAYERTLSEMTVPGGDVWVDVPPIISDEEALAKVAELNALGAARSA